MLLLSQAQESLTEHAPVSDYLKWLEEQQARQPKVTQELSEPLLEPEYDARHFEPYG